MQCINMRWTVNWSHQIWYGIASTLQVTSCPCRNQWEEDLLRSLREKCLTQIQAHLLKQQVSIFTQGKQGSILFCLILQYPAICSAANIGMFKLQYVQTLVVFFVFFIWILEGPSVQTFGFFLFSFIHSKQIEMPKSFKKPSGPLEIPNTPWEINGERNLHTNHPCYWKERDLNQTSRELCSRSISRSVEKTTSNFQWPDSQAPHTLLPLQSVAWKFTKRHFLRPRDNHIQPWDDNLSNSENSLRIWKVMFILHLLGKALRKEKHIYIYIISKTYPNDTWSMEGYLSWNMQ